MNCKSNPQKSDLRNVAVKRKFYFESILKLLCFTLSPPFLFLFCFRYPCHRKCFKSGKVQNLLYMFSRVHTNFKKGEKRYIYSTPFN